MLPFKALLRIWGLVSLCSLVSATPTKEVEHGEVPERRRWIEYDGRDGENHRRHFPNPSTVISTATETKTLQIGLSTKTQTITQIKTTVLSVTKTNTVTKTRPAVVTTATVTGKGKSTTTMTINATTTFTVKSTITIARATTTTTVIIRSGTVMSTATVTTTSVERGATLTTTSTVTSTTTAAGITLTTTAGAVTETTTLTSTVTTTTIGSGATATVTSTDNFTTTATTETTVTLTTTAGAITETTTLTSTITTTSIGPGATATVTSTDTITSTTTVGAATETTTLTSTLTTTSVEPGATMTLTTTEAAVTLTTTAGAVTETTTLTSTLTTTSVEPGATITLTTTEAAVTLTTTAGGVTETTTLTATQTITTTTAEAGMTTTITVDLSTETTTATATLTQTQTTTETVGSRTSSTSISSSTTTTESTTATTTTTTSTTTACTPTPYSVPTETVSTCPGVPTQGLRNPSFEDNLDSPSPWTPSQFSIFNMQISSGSDAEDGCQYLTTAASDNYPSVAQGLDASQLCPNTYYQISMWYRSPNFCGESGGLVFLVFQDSTAADIQYLATGIASSDWFRVQTVVLSGQGPYDSAVAQVAFGFQCYQDPSAQFSVDFDNVQLVAIPTPVYPTCPALPLQAIVNPSFEGTLLPWTSDVRDFGNDPGEFAGSALVASQAEGIAGPEDGSTFALITVTYASASDYGGGVSVNQGLLDLCPHGTYTLSIWYNIPIMCNGYLTLNVWDESGSDTGQGSNLSWGQSIQDGTAGVWTHFIKTGLQVGPGPFVLKDNGDCTAGVSAFFYCYGGARTYLAGLDDITLTLES